MVYSYKCLWMVERQLLHFSLGGERVKQKFPSLTHPCQPTQKMQTLNEAAASSPEIRLNILIG